MPPNINLHRDTKLHQEIPDLTEAVKGTHPTKHGEASQSPILGTSREKASGPQTNPFLPSQWGPREVRMGLLTLIIVLLDFIVSDRALCVPKRMG